MITTNLSPLRVINHAAGIMAREGIRLSVVMLALFTLPTALLMHLWFQVLVPPGQSPTRGSMIAFYTGIVLFGGYMGCVIGRQAVNTATPRPESLAVLLSGSLVRFRRAFWIYVPLYAVAYGLLRIGHLYAMPVTFLLQFYTPGMTLEGQPLRASGRDGWTMTQKHFPSLIVNFGLMSLVSWLFFSTQHPVFDLLSNSLPPLLANDGVAVYNCVPSTLFSIWSASLYLLARSQIAPATATIAQVFE